MTTNHNATLIVEQLNGYIAGMATGTPDQYLRQPNQGMFREPIVREFKPRSGTATFYDESGNRFMEGCTISGGTFLWETAERITTTDVQKKCLDLLLADERMASSDAHWIWRLGICRWEQLNPEQHL